MTEDRIHPTLPRFYTKVVVKIPFAACSQSLVIAGFETTNYCKNCACFACNAEDDIIDMTYL